LAPAADIANTQDSTLCLNKTFEIYDGLNSSYIASVEAEREEHNKFKDAPCCLSFKAYIAAAPVSNITYVCTNSPDDVIDNRNSSVGAPILFGTENGIYALADGQFVMTLESGYVKKIFPVKVGKMQLYFALVGSSSKGPFSLKVSKDSG